METAIIGFSRMKMETATPNALRQIGECRVYLQTNAYVFIYKWGIVFEFCLHIQDPLVKLH